MPPYANLTIVEESNVIVVELAWFEQSPEIFESS